MIVQNFLKLSNVINFRKGQKLIMLLSNKTVKSVRFKIMVTLGLTLITFILGYFIFLRILNKKNDLTLAIQRQEIIESVNSILQTKNDSYQKMVFNYAVFSWMIDFIQHPSNKEGELTITHPQNLGFDFIQIYNLNKELVYSDLTSDIKQPIGLDSPAFDTLYHIRNSSFFVKTKYGLAQVTASTVHPSDDYNLATTPKGFIIFGKLWDADYINTLKKITNCSITLHLDTISQKINSDEMGEVYLKDYHLQKIAHINISKNNPFLDNLKLLNNYFDIFFIAFCLVLFVITFLTYNALVLLPLRKIEASLNTEKLESIDKLSDRADEFGKIAKLIKTFFLQRNELRTKINELGQAHESLQKLNVELCDQKAEIEEQYSKLHFLNNEMQSQNDEIVAIADGLQLANKEITDSINYASIIQKAVLAPSYELSRIFKDHFIIYKPKNIVSGDFYWFKEMKNGDGILAVADCTGHGLSGSLLSMLGISFLNQIMSQLDDEDYTAASILDYLKSFFIQTLHQKGDLEYVQDGMHIALCIFDKTYRTMQYATAFHTICLVRKNQDTGIPEMTEYKGNRIPVGIYITDENFTNHTVDLQKDDAIYMYSDGITDQFGGPNNKKFMPVKMRNLLTAISQDPLDEQKEKVVLEYEIWKGNMEQTDDVIVVGIKVP